MLRILLLIRPKTNRGYVHLVNTSATENIAEICKKINAKLLYTSTDYVFNGIKDGFYEVDDETNPINVYGKSKLLGEEAVQKILKKYFIVRISWVFGKLATILRNYDAVRIRA